MKTYILLAAAVILFAGLLAIDIWAWQGYGPVAIERTGHAKAIAMFFTDWSAGKTPVKQTAD